MNIEAKLATAKVRRKQLRFAVTVDFVVKPQFMAKFMELCCENAQASIADEKECFRFDVLTPFSKAANKIFLYEIYASQKAFEAHLKTPHYQNFDKLTAHMVISKTPAAFDLDEFAKAAQ